MDPRYFFPANLPTSSSTASVLEAQNHIAQATFIDQGFVAAGLGHPSYEEEGNGSSKKAIAKYIEHVYSNLPLTHETLLAHQLKRLKNSGQIIMVKKSYKLPRSGTPHAASNSATQPGRRSRPPKLKPIPSTQPVLVSHGLVDEAPTLSSDENRPGLPPKSGTQPEQGGTVLGKRGRGKPPGSKNMKLGPEGVKKGPARLPIGQTPLVEISYASDTIPSTTIGDESVPKRRGRPKKVGTAAATPAPPWAVNEGGDTLNSDGVKKAIGLPKKNAPVVGNEAITIGVESVPKRRGRPKKVAIAVPAPPSVVNEGGDTLNSDGVKKAVDRPRKNAPAAGNGMQLRDLNTNGYGELKRKFDFFQAKVKAAVDVIKPCISNATALSVLTAIQELDGLASMDVSVPLKDQTQTKS